MNKVFYFLLSITLVITSCKKDDDGAQLIPPRDRGEVAMESQEIIELYLNTHFYNYEEFENPSINFDFKIRFDTIAGENSNKTKLKTQVSVVNVRDRIDSDLTYDLYYLRVNEGGGDETANFPDIATITYEGISISEKTIKIDSNGDGDTTDDEDEIITVYPTNLFDGSVTPVAFDLTAVVNGLQDALIAEEELPNDDIVKFRTAKQISQNPDGTTDFEDFGIGAVFIPSGLGYFNTPPSATGIGLYDQLIFTFQLLDVIEGDQDNDGVLSINEDRNGNGFEEDDDTDNDGLPNFADNDDDNDGRPTREEISDANGNLITDPALYPDTDGDGTPDYLDSNN